MHLVAYIQNQHNAVYLCYTRWKSIHCCFASNVIIKIKTFEQSMSCKLQALLQSSLQNVHALFITVQCVRMWKALEWKALYQVTVTLTLMCCMHVLENSVKSSHSDPSSPYIVWGSAQIDLPSTECWSQLPGTGLRSEWDHLLQQSCIPLPLCQCIPPLSWPLGVQSVIPVSWAHFSRDRTEIRGYHHPQNRNTESFYIPLQTLRDICRRHAVWTCSYKEHDMISVHATASAATHTTLWISRKHVLVTLQPKIWK